MLKEKDSVLKKNEFVKREQDKMKSMMGNRPSIKPEDSKFNAEMMNDGESCRSFAKKLTAGIDEKAFPVS